MQRQHVDGYVVQGNRHEDLPLAPSQLFSDRLRQGGELLAALGLLAGLGRHCVRKLPPNEVLGSWRVVAPSVPGNLARDLEDHELVGPGREAAEPTELADLGQDVHHRVVGALLCDVVEFRAGERFQLGATAVQLVQRRALQEVVELGDRLLVARVVRAQLLDPSPRRRIPRRGSLLGGRRRPFDAHGPIVVAHARVQVG